MRVASGDAEFCLTGVTYFLFAQKEGGDRFPARFVSALHQRSPVGAIVAATCDISVPEDLAGRRIGRSDTTGWLADEAAAALAERGVGAPSVVPLGRLDGPAALARGEIDAVATFVDASVRVSAKGGVETRPVHVGLDMYASGLVAGDHVPADVVVRMNAAVAAAFEQQRERPEAGVTELCERFPETAPDHASASWALLAPYVFTGPAVGTMKAACWRDTISWLVRVHSLSDPGGIRVYRPELA